MIRLSVPGSLEYRDMAIRVVTSACKLLRPDVAPASAAGADEFDSQVVSAFGEAFNNLCIHGYEGRASGDIDIELTTDAERLTIRIRDTGKAFDPTQFEDPPDALPERGMGIFIIRSFMDDVAYAAGPPNQLSLSKRWRPAEERDDDPKSLRRPERIARGGGSDGGKKSGGPAARGPNRLRHAAAATL